MYIISDVHNVVVVYTAPYQITCRSLGKCTGSRAQGHFCGLLGRLPEAKDPACRDILFTVIKGHYIAAACKEIGIEIPDSVPCDLEELIHVQRQSMAQQCQYIYSIAQVVVAKCSVIEGSIPFESVAETSDMVHNYMYARPLCHYGSLALEFVDAWEEGDGDRILRCWKIFLLHFYENGRTKYGKHYVCSYRSSHYPQHYPHRSSGTDLLMHMED